MAKAVVEKNVLYAEILKHILEWPNCDHSFDKTQSSYNDTLDALRLAVKPYRFD